jgi:uncharacterized repeat protein (TIGR03803 family)
LLETRCVPALFPLGTFIGANGATPSGGLVRDSGGNLFGTTVSGGASGNGVLFEVPSGSTTPTGIASFAAASTGANPYGTLLASGSNAFLGTTSLGGAANEGTVFREAGGTITTLASFNGTNGRSPRGGLLMDAAGDLFGATANGGSDFSMTNVGVGTAFEIKAGTSVITTLFSFTSSNLANGLYPQAGLAKDSNLNLFGTTQMGGTSGNGTIFELQNSGGTYTFKSLLSFNGSNGSSPEADLIVDASGNLFGTTYYGGALGFGTVFEVPYNSSSHMYGGVADLVSFSGGTGSAPGANPAGGLVMDASGNLYGTTKNLGGSGSSNGTVFALQKNGSNYDFVNLVTFNTSDGAAPQADLIKNGANIFGTTSAGGGVSALGTVFEVQAPRITTTSLVDWTINLTGYSKTISATGGGLNGTGSFTFGLGMGTLPTGLMLNGSSGVLSGTPTAAGTYTFTISATDTLGGTASQSFTVVINPAVMITTAALANWTDNQAGYNQTCSTTGGTGAKTCALTMGALPPGLTLNTTSGVLSGTPSSPGTYSCTITATDAVGATASKLFSVTIALPVAISTTTLPNWTVNKPGYSQTVSAGGGTGTLTFSQSMGTLPTGLMLSAAGVLSGTPTAPGTFTFTVTATDTVNATGSEDFTVVINQAVTITTATLPIWTANFPYSQTINATGGTGAKVFATSSGTIPAGLTLKASGVLSGTPTLAGSFTFAVTASDSVGAVSSARSYTLVINPALSITTTTLANWAMSQPGYNQTINATGGTGAKMLAATAGTLPPGLTLSGGGVLAGTPTTAGDYSFTVTAVDGVGASANKGYVVTISGPATELDPEVDPATPEPETPGSSFGLIVTARDTGGRRASDYSGHRATFSGGPGTMVRDPVTGLMVPLNGFGYTFVAADQGQQTFQVVTYIPQPLTVQVSDGTIQGITAPAIAVVPGPAGPFRVMPHFSAATAGEGFLVDLYESADFSGTVSVSTTDPQGSVPATATVTHGFGYFAATLETVKGGPWTITVGSAPLQGVSPPVAVAAGPAVKLAFAAQPVDTPTGDSLPPVTVQLEDPYGNLVASDSSDSVTVGIGSGPGTFVPGSMTTAPLINGVATFSNVALATLGTSALSEVVPGKYIGPDSASFRVTSLQVAAGSFAGTPSGFSLDFNAPYLIDSLTPVLYGGGFGAAGPVPSVTLTQTKDSSGSTVNVPVQGSLVLDAADHRITFVATDTALEADNHTPPLPDGTYAAVVHGTAASDGFQALNAGGGFLDGLGNGQAGSGDFTATYTVNTTGQDIIWVPDTAEGPGQTLNAPGMNQIAGGFPVYLDDTTGKVTNVQVNLSYDPSLLTVTGVTGTGFMLLGTSFPGEAMLQYNGPALPAGSQTPIGYLTAMVPSGSAAHPVPYKAKDLLHLAGGSLNGGSIAVGTLDALHVVAYVGDANGDGLYSSTDAAKITRAALQTDSGFTPYPLVDPVIVADTDGAGFLPADAALQANEAGVDVPTANLPRPPIPGGVVFQAIGNNIDPTLGLPVRLTVSVDGTVSVPVNLDDAHPAGSTGLLRAHLALRYDPRLFAVSAADVHPGSLLASGGWEIEPTIDPTSGQIAIALSSETPIRDAVGGSLVTIDFHLSAGIPVACTVGAPIALVASATPEGEWVATELEDAQGVFTLSSSLGADISLLSSRPVAGTSGAPGRYATAPASQSKDLPPAHAPAEEPATLPITVRSSLPGPDLAAEGQVNGAPPEAMASTAASAGARPFAFGFGEPLVSQPLLNVVPGAVGWHLLTDRVFQVLGSTLPTYLSWPGSPQKSEPPALRRLPAGDDLDVLSGEPAVSALEFAGRDGWSALRRPLSRVARPVDAAAADQILAQEEELTNPPGEEDSPDKRTR